MLNLLLSSLMFAQAAVPVTAPASAPATLEEDRLRACLDEARRDPAAGITTASQWLEGTGGVERSIPLQCLGYAYTGLLRWEAAQQAFTSARDARHPSDLTGRARLGAMAGNAALAGDDAQDALTLLRKAQDDASGAGDNTLAGSIAGDRARALVALDRQVDATLALAQARELTPQDASIWLLSATLSRRMEDLARAQEWIETAVLLDPANPAIGLEAGLIAALGGFEAAAMASWQSVIDTSPRSPQAATARNYLQQMEEAPPPQ